MITTEIIFLDHIQLSQEEIDIIKEAAYEDCVQKLMNISDYSINEFELNFSYELICKVRVTPKIKNDGLK